MGSTPETGKVFAQVKLTFLRKLPIKVSTKNSQKPFIGLVNHILTITKDDGYFDNLQKQARVKALEAEIDQIVYNLYDLTSEEIKIVEGGNVNADWADKV